MATEKELLNILETNDYDVLHDIRMQWMESNRYNSFVKAIYDILSTPENKNVLIQKVVCDKKFYRKLVLNIHDLKQILHFFPEYRNEVRVCSAGIGIWTPSALAEIFPEIKGDLFEEYYSDLGKFKKNINDIYGLTLYLADIFREYQDKFIHYLLADQSEWDRLITNGDSWLELAKVFPDYAEVIFDRVWKNKTTKYLSDDSVYLRAAALFPQHHEKLLERFLTDLRAKLNLLPQGFVPKVEKYPKYKDALLQRILLDAGGQWSNPGQPNGTRLLNFIGQTLDDQKHHLKTLIHYILKDPVLFDKLISNHETWLAAKPYCSDISRLRNIQTRQDARTELKAIMIEKNKEAVTAKLAALNRGGFFYGAELRNTGSNPDERRTSHLPLYLMETIFDAHFGPKKK